MLSVYDKNGIVEFAEGLVKLGWQIYASGGTARTIHEHGLAVTDISKLVGGQAILGHRVVTLSREIAAGLLANPASESDRQELATLNIPLIDLVCVDMYPLEETINNKEASKSDVIEKTDIGGPTMLRAAAKGRRIVLSSPEQRQLVLQWLQDNKPNEEQFIDNLVARAEYEVTRYVFTSAMYHSDHDISGFIAKRITSTKYGENPQQTEAALYADNRVVADPLGLDQFTHVQGIERSFINMTDIDRLLQTITHIAAGFEKNFSVVPAIAVGVKHGNACGAGVATTPLEAVKKMLEGDTRAIFGGIIMVSSNIDKTLAEALMYHAMEGDKPRLLDGVVGASVTEDALELLSRNKLRVVVNPALATLTQLSLDQKRRLRPVRGGALEQPNYDFVIDLKADYMAYHGKELREEQRHDLILAWAIGATSNSNTITLVKNGQLIGNGVGQQDRIGAAQLALTRTTTALPQLTDRGDKIQMQITLDRKKLAGACAYSDSFFPFPDGPGLLAQAGITAILASSGSVADEAVIKSLSDKGITLAMVPDKIGRGFYLH